MTTVKDVEKAIYAIADRKIEKATEKMRLKHQDIIHDMLLNDINTSIEKYKKWCNLNYKNAPDLKRLLSI